MLKRWEARRAARAFATRLGPQLAHDYGAAEYYTAEQINAAVMRAKLPSRHLALGLAGFLPETQFAARQRAGDPSRDELRALLDRFKQTKMSTGFYAAPENADARSGAWLPPGA